MTVKIHDLSYWRDFGGPNGGPQINQVAGEIDLLLDAFKAIQSYEFIKTVYKQTRGKDFLALFSNLLVGFTR
jgi:hypothetical protein